MPPRRAIRWASRSRPLLASRRAPRSASSGTVRRERRRHSPQHPEPEPATRHGGATSSASRPPSPRLQDREGVGDPLRSTRLSRRAPARHVQRSSWVASSVAVGTPRHPQRGLCPTIERPRAHDDAPVHRAGSTCSRRRARPAETVPDPELHVPIAPASACNAHPSGRDARGPKGGRAPHAQPS